VRRARRSLHAMLGSAAICGGILAGGDTAAASEAGQLRPVNLRVEGGESAWHPDRSFRISWDSPLGIAHYRVRNTAGNVVTPEARTFQETKAINSVEVPQLPGVYTADVWLEGPGGEVGPQTSATLRFDDVQPDLARPLTASWVSGNAPAILKIEHPRGPQPISGIRGYAVSVDRGGGEYPCEGPDRCSLAETDVQGGIEGDTVSLGILPEGTSTVRAVAVSGSGMRSPEAASATLRVDATVPVVALSGVPRGWAKGPVLLTAAAADALSGMTADGPSGPFTAIAIDDGVPTTESGPSVTAVVRGDGSHQVTFYARDTVGNIAGSGGRQAAPTETVRIDEGAPTLAFARFQDPTDPERIEAAVNDRLSGPDPRRGSIAVRPANSQQRFQPLPTAVSDDGRLVARWDSDSFPAGDYEFRATGYDAAGNSSDSGRRSNGARMVLANPLKMPTTLQAGFGGRRLVWQRCARTAGRRRCRRQVIESFDGRPTTRAVPFGHGVQFGGRLTSIAGAPLGGREVQVIESFDTGAVAGSRTTTVETAADGAFATHLAAGPSRHVEAVFAGDRVLSRSSGGAVRLDVLAGVRLRASVASAHVGGRPVVFSGRVGGLDTSTPASGRPVELQFHLPGATWAEFRTVQTDARGRFRYAYRFSDDDSRGVRFQFRAYVPSGGDWPYEPAASRPVAVTGR
jgi:hypothetical protein